MDHLPYPSESRVPKIEIPYICNETVTCQNDSWKLYPVHAGWIISNEASWKVADDNMTAQRAQSWLCFGFLRRLLGSDFREEDFLQPSSTYFGTIVTIKPLRDLFVEKDWANISVAFWDDLEIFIQEVMWLSSRGDSALMRLVSLSLRVLAWSMACLFRRVVIAKQPKQKEHWKKWSCGAGDPLIQESMLTLGWCPFLVHHYHSVFALGRDAALYYLSGIDKSEFDGDHSLCSNEECVAHNVDMLNYTTKHVQEGCRCSLAGPDYAKVKRIIQNDGIPLIEIRALPRNENVQVRVVEASYGIEYTAVSHVWSGGLGNPASNTLPSCELKELLPIVTWCKDTALPEMARASQISTNSTVSLDTHLLPYGKRPAYFWLDTLCIPPAGPESDVLKRKSIDKMASIYAGATDVLIIDPKLRSTKAEKKVHLEVHANILVCPWMTRSWTFQEACLAHRTKFWMADCVVKVALQCMVDDLDRDLYTQYQTSPGSVFENEVRSNLHAITDNMYDTINFNVNPGGSYEESRPSQSQRFADVWTELLRRSTSQKDDLPGILAILLDLDANEVQLLPEDQRIKAIFRTLPVLPIRLLFSFFGPKKTQSKSAWIPESVSRDLDRYDFQKTMVWCPNDERLEIVLTQSDYTVFTVDELPPVGKLSILTYHDLPDSGKHARESDTIMLELGALMEDLDTSPSKSQHLYLILDGWTSKGDGGFGALFELADETVGESLKLVWKCSVAYARKNNILGSEKNTYPETRLSWEPLPRAVVVDCDAASFPRLLHQRPQASDLQRPLFPPVFLFSFPLWTISACLNLWRAPKRLQESSVTRRTIFRIFVAGITSVRFIYFVAEHCFLDEMTQKLRYDKLALSYDPKPRQSVPQSFLARFRPYQLGRGSHITMNLHALAHLWYTTIIYRSKVSNCVFDSICTWAWTTTFAEMIGRLTGEAIGRTFGVQMRFLDKI